MRKLSYVFYLVLATVLQECSINDNHQAIAVFFAIGIVIGIIGILYLWATISDYLYNRKNRKNK